MDIKDINRFRRAGLIIVGTALVIITVVWIILGLCFSQGIAFAQFIFTIVVFAVIWFTFYLALVQFRKSMAKPLIKVAFNKKGEQQATLTFKNGKPGSLPSVWLINEGNAVARYFQIDFTIPENIGRPSAYVPLSKEDGSYILSYVNEGRYTLFVNRPYSDPNMLFSSAMNLSKCIELNVASFKIKYKVYGDWALTQKGELTIKCNRQETN